MHHPLGGEAPFLIELAIMDDPKKDVAHLALTVIQRFVGAQPDALSNMRAQVRGELDFAEANANRLRAELAAIDELLAMIEQEAEEAASPHAQLAFYPALPLRKAILALLSERPGYWDRDDLLRQLTRRGWAPGGKNPRNTLISRLSEMAKEGLIERLGDGFAIPNKTEVPAV